MFIRCGYELGFECAVPTAMLLQISIRPERRGDLKTPEIIATTPQIPFHSYIDGFGNACTRLVAPPGVLTLSADFIVEDSGEPDVVNPQARQTPVPELPDDILVFLLGSRYCDTQKLSDLAWSRFGNIEPGWTRVQAILDYAHRRLTFGYKHARSDRTAWDAHQEEVGVCRDFAHLAIALCRCMNIPARYCTGYLGDIGIPVDGVMDFSAWLDVWLDGAWYSCDARHNRRRIGRILMARGRDATDAAISTAFGSANLMQFKVMSEEVG